MPCFGAVANRAAEKSFGKLPAGGEIVGVFSSLRRLDSIKENPARWIELLKKIKVGEVSSQKRATGSPGAYVQQSIV